MINQTHNKMIDYYSNQIESFRIIFNDDDFDELINEFFKSYNYMIPDYLEQIAKMNNEFKPIHINKKILKHVSKHNIDDDENKSFIKSNIKFMINQTHNKMIDSYSNQIELFRTIFNDDDFDELIDEFFKYYNYMTYDYLEKNSKNE